MEEDKKKKGFWMRMWMEWGRGHSTVEEDYRFLLFEDGYEKKDEDSLKAFVQEWADYDKRGVDREYYRYGYDIVDNPPMEWFDKELKRLIECKDALTKKIEFINGEKSLLMTGNGIK